MQKSDRIKAEVSLKSLAEAAGVAWDLRKSKQGRGDWWGPCPFHAESTSSFHVVEPGGRGGYYKCFGCGAGGTAIDFTMAAQGLDFVGAVRRLAEDAGIAGELSPEKKKSLEDDRARLKAQSEKAALRQAEYGHRHALDLWRGATPAASGLVPAYLAARGVRLAAIGGVPPTIRFAPLLAHRQGDKVTHSGPAMVAAIGRGRVLGVHRTWITETGRARHGNGQKVEKQWIGRTGELMGQPCVLSTPTPAVVVGEGIETTLTAWSALEASGRLGWSAEAALSRGAITGPATDPAQLWTPRPGVSEVLILGEGSKKDPRQARELYEGARARLSGLGLGVLLTVPFGRWDLDADFADLAASEFLKGR